MTFAILGACLVALAAASPTPPAPADLKLQLVGVEPGALAELRVVQWHGGTPEPVQFAVEKGTGPPRLRVEQGCDPGSRYVVVGAATVSRVIEPDAAACAAGAPIAVEMLPAARLAGTLVVAHGVESSGAVRLRVERCEEPHRRQRLDDLFGEYPVALAAGGAFDVIVPAGCVDVTLTAADLAPHTWWGLQLDPGGRRAVGRVELTRGASMLARVVSAEDGVPVADTTVLLLREDAYEEALALSRDGTLPRAVATSISGERGWVRLTGVGEGRYVVEALAQGWAPYFSPSIALADAGETVLGDLRLERPAEVEVRVAGRVDLGDRVLKVSLRPSDPRVRSLVPIVETVGRDGTVLVTGVMPGEWLVELLVCARGGCHDIADARVETRAGQRATVRLELPELLFHGRVVHGDEGVEGSLRLRATIRQRGCGSDVYTETDAEGSFTALLKCAGAYAVEVVRERDGRSFTVPAAAFESPDEEVLVQVPEGVIQGTALDGDGEPVAEAHVWADRSPAAAEEMRFPVTSRATAGDDGGFELEGLAAGRWRIEARAGKLWARPVEVSLGEDVVLSGVALELRETGLFSGRIVTDDGRPVTHPACWGGVMGAGGVEPFMLAFKRDGSFETEVSGDAVGKEAFLQIVAPGVAFDGLRCVVGEKVRLVVARVGGDVVLVAHGARPPTAAWWTALVFVSPDGRFFTTGLAVTGQALGRYSEEAGGRVVLRNVAAGPWRVTRPVAEKDAVLLLSGRGNELPAVGFVTVTPGARVEVAIDVE